MIKSSLIQPQQPKVSAPSVKVAAVKKKAPQKSSGTSIFKGMFYMLLLAILAAVGYVSYYGMPDSVRNAIPPEVTEFLPPEILEFLGLTEVAVKQAEAQGPNAPKLIAQGRKPEDPSIPINGSVEEVVRTMRPEIFFKNKVLSEYKEQPVSNRITYQKQAFHIMLSTFYNVTPDGVGYLDLAYQAPNFFFARAIALDARTRASYMDNLESRVSSLVRADSSTSRDGNVEFIVFGAFQQPKFSDLKTTQLVHFSRINSEILALRNLAITHQVRLSGLEKPHEEKVGSYRRVVLHTVTDADYPSLLNFAEALQESEIAFGVQQFSSRPSGPEKMQSVLEFVLYASTK